MKCDYSCKSPEHGIARREFLGGIVGGAGVLAGGVPAFATPDATQKLQSTQRRVLVVFMSGGLSQLESWDPKPGTETGGPFSFDSNPCFRESTSVNCFPKQPFTWTSCR